MGTGSERELLKSSRSIGRPTKITTGLLCSIIFRRIESMLSSSRWKDDGASKEVGSERYGECVEGIGHIELLSMLYALEGVEIKSSFYGLIPFA